MTALKRKAKTSPKAQAGKADRAKKRHRIDWEAVERDFRTGKFTQTELATKHELDPATLSRQIKKDQALDIARWQRDLTEAVRQATNAALMTDLVKSEIKEGQEQVNSAVKAAAEVNMRVILAHRRDAQEAREAMDAARAMVLKCGAQASDIREAATFASAVESLSRTAKNAVEIERKAFKLDDEPEASTGGEGPAGRMLSDAERAVRLARLLQSGVVLPSGALT